MKKNIEIKATKFEKTCILIQAILTIIVLGTIVYANINNIEDNKVIDSIINYTPWVVIILMWLPFLFKKK